MASTLTNETVVAEIDLLLARAGLKAGDHLPIGEFGSIHGKATSDVVALNTSFSAAVTRLSPPGSAYRAIADAAIGRTGSNSGYALEELVGILNGLRADYEGDHMRTVEELVHADLFADFLDMARELVEKHYKDPAAVIAGSVLEEHIRKLSDRFAIPIEVGGRPKKADTLNADLAKGGVYNKLEQKNVTAWLGLRNDAAHGNYDAYDEAQVRGMVQSVGDFLTRHPA